MVWIRFPNLNLLYYDESFLLSLTTAISNSVRVDSNTLNVEHGRFARICIEINLTKSVVRKFDVNGHWYKVQYEGLHIICASCGCYGRHTRNCSKPIVTPSSTEGISSQNAAEVVQSPTSNTVLAAVVTGVTNEGTKSHDAVIAKQLADICINGHADIVRDNRT